MVLEMESAIVMEGNSTVWSLAVIGICVRVLLTKSLSCSFENPHILDPFREHLGLAILMEEGNRGVGSGFQETPQILCTTLTLALLYLQEDCT